MLWSENSQILYIQIGLKWPHRGACYNTSITTDFTNIQFVKLEGLNERQSGVLLLFHWPLYRIYTSMWIHTGIPRSSVVAMAPWGRLGRELCKYFWKDTDCGLKERQRLASYGTVPDYCRGVVVFSGTLTAAEVSARWVLHFDSVPTEETACLMKSSGLAYYRTDISPCLYHRYSLCSSCWLPFQTASRHLKLWKTISHELPDLYICFCFQRDFEILVRNEKCYLIRIIIMNIKREKTLDQRESEIARELFTPPHL